MASKKHLIYKEDLLETVLDHFGVDLAYFGPDLQFCQEAINLAPTVDAVEVVRCKDCEHCKDHPTSDKVKMCTNEQQWVTECYPLVHDNDFCSFGERKDNG